MRSYKGIFYRTDEISREPDQCPEWIDLLATKVMIDSEKIASASSKTAVEVARNRNSEPSIYEMMSAIVSGQKPKYSSVEEAVLDYQKRTGLSEYLKRAGDSDLSALAGQIVAEAAKGVCSECGNSYAECECDDDDAKDGNVDDEDNKDWWHPSDLEDDDESKMFDDEDDEIDQDEEKDNGLRDWRDAFKIDGNDPDISDEERNERAEKLLQRNEDYRKDYGDSRDMTEDELEANPGKKKLISEAEEETPELLLKHPSIEHFLKNIIDTNVGIQMPAILHSLIETFGRDGIDHQIFSDRPFLNWINKKLIDKGISKNDAPSQIGRGVGTQVEYSGDKDSNKDPFTLLVPDKSLL